MATLVKNSALQTGLGANIHLLNQNQMKARFPWFRIDYLAGASCGLSGEGWLDPRTLPQVFRAKARAGGDLYPSQGHQNS
jgi:FAD-dependent oxidoreductase domain-containing protein 1